MTMANPYAPEALASTMGPTQSTVPLVLAPGSLAQAMPSAAPMGLPVPPPGAVPPPTVADPSMLAPATPPPPDAGPLFTPVNGAAPPVPNQSTMGPEALPPAPPPPGPQVSVAPEPVSADPNMTSAATGEAVTAAPPMVEQGTQPAKPAPPKTLRPAGRVMGDPMLQELGQVRGEIGQLQKARTDVTTGYETRTGERAEQFTADANDIVRTRNLQNATDAYHVNQLKEFDDTATAQSEKEFADIQKTAKSVGEMKIDPKAAMPKTVTGQIFAAIGAAIGAGASAISGGPNAFNAIMNHAIETQMRADEANIANARGGLQQKVSLYGIMRQQLGDKRAAKAAYRASAWDYAENQIRTLKEKTTNRNEIQRYDDLLTQVEKAKLGDEISFKTGRKQELVTALTQRAAAATARDNEVWNRYIETRKLDIEQQKANAEGHKGKDAAAKEAREALQTFVPGFKGHVANPGITIVANKLANHTDNGLQAIARIKKLFAKGSRLSPKDVGAMKQAVRALTVSEKDRQELGQLTGGDWNLMALSPDDVVRMNRSEQEGAINELELFLRGQRANFRKNFIVRNADGSPNIGDDNPYYIPDIEKTGNTDGSQ